MTYDILNRKTLGFFSTCVKTSDISFDPKTLIVCICSANSIWLEKKYPKKIFNLKHQYFKATECVAKNKTVLTIFFLEVN